MTLMAKKVIMGDMGSWSLISINWGEFHTAVATHLVGRINQLRKLAPAAPVVRPVLKALHKGLNREVALVEAQVDKTTEVDEVGLRLAGELGEDGVEEGKQRRALGFRVEKVREVLLRLAV
jgi:hypothetical protein